MCKLATTLKYTYRSDVIGTSHIGHRAIITWLCCMIADCMYGIVHS